MTAENMASGDNDAAAQQRVADFFRLHVRLYGPDWRALGWQSRKTQFKRFAILAEVGKLNNMRVLDVGCGLGDLYGYLQSQNVPTVYTGYDLVPEMVVHARQRYPEVQFTVRDVLQDFGDEQFDYILSSGAFNVNFGNNVAAVQRVLREMFQHCTRGVAINFLSATSAYHDPVLYRYKPQEMYAFCRTFCSYVHLREGYLSNDFTLYLYHQELTL